MLKTKDDPKRCPACFKHPEGFTGGAGAGNAHSRYVDVYICSDCGRREAFEKFFWAATCPASLLRISAKRRGMSVKELIATCIVAGVLILPGGRADAGWRYTSTGPYGGFTTYCTHTVYGTNCNTQALGQRPSNDPRVISVPQPEEKPPEMTEAERAAARRATCASRSVTCLPEPAW